VAHGNGSGRCKRGIFVEIDIVPLIDVLLVLLVIAMIVLPHKRKGLKAEIPQPAPTGEEVRVSPEPVVIQVLADGSLRINQTSVGWEALQSVWKTSWAPGEDAWPLFVATVGWSFKWLPGQ
jgi:biopolymer transport protein ExbD